MKKTFLFAVMTALAVSFTACEKNSDEGSSDLKTVDQLAAMYHKPFQQAIGIPLNWGFKDSDEPRIREKEIEYSFTTVKIGGTNGEYIGLDNYINYQDYVDEIHYYYTLSDHGMQLSKMCNWLKHHGDKIVLDGVTYTLINSRVSSNEGETDCTTMNQVIEAVEKAAKTGVFTADVLYQAVDNRKGKDDTSSVIWIQAVGDEPKGASTSYSSAYISIE